MLKRCETGFRLSDNSTSCVDEDECSLSICQNGGTCVNRDRGQGFYCICPSAYSGEVCNALRQEKVMRLSTAALAAILICLLNILSKSLTSQHSKRDNLLQFFSIYFLAWSIISPNYVLHEILVFFYFILFLPITSFYYFI